MCSSLYQQRRPQQSKKVARVEPNRYSARVFWARPRLFSPHPQRIMIELDFQKSELLPAIAQDHQTGEVLMLAFINRLAWEKTLETGKAHYWSRSRQKLWLKGESSGHVQMIKEILVDCDQDAVIYKVEQLGGAACHTGRRSCFYRRVAGDALAPVYENKIFEPDQVYGKKQGER